jgi:hypothetical protein
MDEVALLAIDSLFRDGATRTKETALMGETTPSTRSERAARRAERRLAAARLLNEPCPSPPKQSHQNHHHGTYAQPKVSSRLTLPSTRMRRTTPIRNAKERRNTPFTSYRQQSCQKTSLCGRNYRIRATSHREWNYCHCRNTSLGGHLTSSS